MRGSWLTTAAMLAALVSPTKSALAYILEFLGSSGEAYAGGKWGGWHDPYHAFSYGSAYEEDPDDPNNCYYWDGYAYAEAPNLASCGGVGAGWSQVGWAACDTYTHAGGKGTGYTWCDADADAQRSYSWRVLSEYGNTGSITVTLQCWGSGSRSVTSGWFRASVEVSSGLDSYARDVLDWSDTVSFDVPIGGIIEVSCRTEAFSMNEAGWGWESECSAEASVEVWLGIPGEVPIPPLDIETVPVGNPGNVGELSGEGAGGWGPDRICGAVDYTYNMGKYEVTAGQYTAFLNAVAVADAYGLYNTEMWDSEYGCKIQRSGSPGSYTYSVAADWADRPVNYVSWGDAARFCNWLANGQPRGAQDLNTTEDGSYYLDGATSRAALMAVTRDPNATWVIPSEDEWYKAAYHKSDGATGNYFDYPTSSDSHPSNELVDPDPGNNATYYRAYDGHFTIGSPYWRTEAGAHENSDSPYGTFDQGGNIWEWDEAVIGGSCRSLRGGSFYLYGNALHASFRGYYYDSPTNEFLNVGFRVAEIPRPIHNVTQDTWHWNIREAIDDANDNDEIELSPGPYRGPGNRDIDFGGTNLTVRSTDPNDPNVVAATVIDCEGNHTEPHRAFYFHSGEGSSTIIEGLTIVNGYVTAPSYDDPNGWGGGIACDAGSSPTLRKCTITGCHAVLGGGVYCGLNTRAAITDCVLSGNSAETGGGICCADNADPNIVRCRIAGNAASGNGAGIACYYNSNPKITNCAIDLNAAPWAGGIFCLDGSSATVSNCSLVWNSGTPGGGITEIDSVPVVRNCILWGNGPDQLWGAPAVTYSAIEGGWTGEGNIDADPCFVDADGPDDDPTTWQDNNYHLIRDSACRDAGAAGDYSGQTDLDGQPRVMPEGGVVDMGSDEYPGGPWYCLLRLGMEYSGTVEIEPNDPALPFAYLPGTEVTLTAHVAAPHAFERWELYDPNHPSDANYLLHDHNNPITIMMTTDREVTAVFKCGGGADPMLPMVLAVLGLFVWGRRRG